MKIFYSFLPLFPVRRISGKAPQKLPITISSSSLRFFSSFLPLPRLSLHTSLRFFLTYISSLHLPCTYCSLFLTHLPYLSYSYSPSLSCPYAPIRLLLLHRGHFHKSRHDIVLVDKASPISTSDAKSDPTQYSPRKDSTWLTTTPPRPCGNYPKGGRQSSWFHYLTIRVTHAFTQSPSRSIIQPCQCGDH